MPPSIFADVLPGPSIEVLEMKKKYDEDPSDVKINLTVGGYKDEEGQSYILPVVREVEAEMLTEAGHSHEYLPALGRPEVNEAAVRLLLGSEAEAVTSGRAIAVQSIGGTGPLRLGAEFLRQQLGCEAARFSDPTWINHRDIFVKAGFTDVQPYPYLDYSSMTFDFNALMENMKRSKPRTVFILHAQAHNPSGLDPSESQWKQICEVMKRGRLIPFFDCAYQGWASGDLEKDAWAVRHFCDQGMEMMVSQSFGKNLGLYGDRIGFLSLVLADRGCVEAVRSQLTLVLRPMYGNPCRAPARVMEMILLDPARRQQWALQLGGMVDRVKRIRVKLRAMMEERCPHKDWTNITSQTGMFWLSGLTRDQGEELATCHVYMMPSNGRMNLCGLNFNNVKYFADTLAQIVK